MRNSSKTKEVLIYIGLIIWMIVNLFPVYWMFTFSLKSNPEIFGENVIGLPKEWLWSNYSTALHTGNMGLYFMNSAIVAISTILITLIVALMATFALTRLIWKKRKTLNKFFMLGLTIPIHASIVPVYVTPRELDESACIDGCGVFGVFFRIIVPLMKPAVATVGIYTFLQCWNELMFANVFISKNAYRTLPVGVQALSGQYTTEWGPIGAALVLATFPTLFVYIFLSKKIQESFIAGAIKG